MQWGAHGAESSLAGANGRWESIEAWRRPPPWLYLPSLGLLGHGLSIGGDDGREGAQSNRETVAVGKYAAPTAATQPGLEQFRGSGADGATNLVAVSGQSDARAWRQIRGRGTAPGRAGGEQGIIDGEARPANPLRDGEIRGHADVLGAAEENGSAIAASRIGGEVKPRSGDAVAAAADDCRKTTNQMHRVDTDDELKSKAQRRLEARNAHLATSLSDHAERVAKRDAAGDRPYVATAAERLAALRRRIVGRGMEAERPSGEAGSPRRRDTQEAIGRAGAAAPVTGCGDQVTRPVGTIEVQKIQWLHEDGREFRRSTACDEGCDAVVGAAG